MRKRRSWQKANEDDPLSGLINLFDLWIVVVITLTFALLQSAERLDLTYAAEEANTEGASERIEKATQRLPRFRSSESELSGEGELLGTAYRLRSGEVVYVPNE